MLYRALPLVAVLTLTACSEPTDSVLVSAKLQRSGENDHLLLTLENDSEDEMCMTLPGGFEPSHVLGGIQIWTSAGKSKLEAGTLNEEPPLFRLKSHETKTLDGNVTPLLTAPLGEGDCVQLYFVCLRCAFAEARANGIGIPNTQIETLMGSWKVSNGQLVRIPRSAICLAPQNGSLRIGNLKEPPARKAEAP
jgi:hypothetical protein